MLTIRLHRIGKKNQPTFKIVVVDKRISAAAGKFREEIGSIDRISKQTKLNKDRVVYWISKGAQPSPTVNNILIAEKIIEGKKVAVHAQPKKAEGAAAAPAAAKSEPAK
ncbi:MAG: 30S ribosomal protein S16 [Candidatus Paceibacterota bacterium]